MEKKLGILVVHGMGSQDPDFARPMIDEICRRISGSGAIAWRSVYWQDVLEDREIRYFKAAKRSADLDALGLRRFVLTALGDAAAYQQVYSEHNSTYADIHARVHDGVRLLYGDVGSKKRPLVVMAHSLGAHIMSNYIYDRQKPGGAVGLSPFERMQSLAGMITFGCNIPLFTFAYKKVVPIKFPAPQLPPALKSRARWLNFFDPDDILGYPLKPINAAYRKVVSRDIAINAGSIFTSWNPASHSGYWTDNDFTRPVASFLRSLLRAI